MIDALEKELEEAQQRLESLKKKWINYSGNNPNKYRSQITNAQLKIDFIKADIEARRSVLKFKKNLQK